VGRRRRPAWRLAAGRGCSAGNAAGVASIAAGAPRPRAPTSKR
jgi:hypothetical protein